MSLSKWILLITLLVCLHPVRHTKAQTHVSNPNLIIPDNGCGKSNTVAFDTINLARMGLGILGTDIQIDSLCLNVTHGWIDDVDVYMYLGSLSGPFITLTSDNGGSGDNYSNTCFSDYAVTPITEGTAPFSGLFLPEQSFSTFDGFIADTFWIIAICDDANEIEGTLDLWQISFGPPSTCPQIEDVEIAEVDADSARIAWTNPDEIDSFQVFIGPSGFDPDTSQGVNTDTTTFLFIGSYGLEYDVYIRAICDGQSSPYSVRERFRLRLYNDVCSRPIPINVGGCPTNKLFIDNTYAWDEEVLDEPPCYMFDGTERDLWYSIVAVDTAISIVLLDGIGAFARVAIYDSCGIDSVVFCRNGISSNGTDVGGLIEGNTYLLRFFTRQGQEGAFSICLNANEPCPAPGGLQQHSASDSTITVVWDSVQWADSFLVYFDTLGFDWMTATPITVTDTFVTFIGLTEATTFDCYVRSLCHSGDTTQILSPLRCYTRVKNDECSAAIDISNLMNPDDSCSQNFSQLYSMDFASYSQNVGPPSNSCSDGDLTPHDVWFKFIAPPNKVMDLAFLESAGVSSIAEVYRGQCPNDLVSLKPIQCTNDSVRRFVNLPPGDTLLLRIWDFNSNDSGNIVFCIKADSCPAPFELMADNIDTTSATLSWASIPSAQQYLLYVGIDGFNPSEKTPVSLNDTTYFYDQGTYETTYDFYVRIICTNGDTSDFSDVGSFTTLPFCQQVNTVFISQRSDTGALVSWSPTYNSTGYLIDVVLSGNSPDLEHATFTSDTSFAFSNGMANTEYDVYIATICSNDDTTSFVGPFTFNTQCIDLVGDYVQQAIDISSFPFYDQRRTDSCYTNVFEGNISPDVFYRINTGTYSGNVTISTCGPASDFDTYVIVVDENLDSIYAFNDDGPDSLCNVYNDSINLLSYLIVPVTANTTYYLIVEGFQSHTGTYQLYVGTGDYTCPEYLFLHETLDSGNYEAHRAIIFDGIIPPGKNVIFDAPEIFIDPTGVVDGIFETFSEGCN